MNPKVKEVLDELQAQAPKCHQEALFVMARAASILQAVFDPENQPSQYGTTLLPK